MSTRAPVPGKLKSNVSLFLAGTNESLNYLRSGYKRNKKYKETKHYFISIQSNRLVGGDEKESLKSKTVKYDRESQGTRTQERLLWQGLGACTNDRPILSSERAPHKNKAVTVKQ
jgi:hypothetical protein